MAFLWQWFRGTLQWLGLANTHARLVLLGLDNAGKTTLLDMLRNNRLAQHMPTQKPSLEVLQMGNLTFSTYDLGGHAVARKLWRDYTLDCQGIVFLVDAADRARLPESAAELAGLLTHEEMWHIPLVVLGNKIDAPGAASEEELRHALGLYQTLGKAPEDARDWRRETGARPVEVYMCSIVRRQGYREAFQWLGQFVQ
jgi:GTP-binding protein SAR1